MKSTIALLFLTAALVSGCDTSGDSSPVSPTEVSNQPTEMSNDEALNSLPNGPAGEEGTVLPSEPELPVAGEDSPSAPLETPTEIIPGGSDVSEDTESSPVPVP